MTEPQSSPETTELLRELRLVAGAGDLPPKGHPGLAQRAADEIERLLSPAQGEHEGDRSLKNIANWLETKGLVGSAKIVREAALRAPAQAPLQAIVNEQANDPALWCLEPTITEHMLQQALRRLHHAIEGTTSISSTHQTSHDPQGVISAGSQEPNSGMLGRQPRDASSVSSTHGTKP